MKVYISGPSSGLPELDFTGFARVSIQLRAEGHEVVWPYEVLGAELIASGKFDAVFVLDGWYLSRYACLEVAAALLFDIPVINFEFRNTLSKEYILHIFGQAPWLSR